jgi:hypothetical protein
LPYPGRPAHDTATPRVGKTVGEDSSPEASSHGVSSRRKRLLQRLGYGVIGAPPDVLRLPYDGSETWQKCVDKFLLALLYRLDHLCKHLVSILVQLFIAVVVFHRKQRATLDETRHHIECPNRIVGGLLVLGDRFATPRQV